MKSEMERSEGPNDRAARWIAAVLLFIFAALTAGVIQWELAVLGAVLGVGLSVNFWG